MYGIFRRIMPNFTISIVIDAIKGKRKEKGWTMNGKTTQHLEESAEMI
jgi:hypothetical protein